MAHECPECGQTCYCNGDIDDCCFQSEYYYIHCNHYEKCQPEDDEDTLYYEGQDEYPPEYLRPSPSGVEEK